MSTPPKDYHFTAWRRGKQREDVLIRGEVLAPPRSRPALVQFVDTRPKTRGFRLVFEGNNSAVPHVPTRFEQLIPSVPDWIDTLKIALPNDDFFCIQRKTILPSAHVAPTGHGGRRSRY